MQQLPKPSNQEAKPQQTFSVVTSDYIDKLHKVTFIGLNFSLYTMHEYVDILLFAYSLRYYSESFLQENMTLMKVLTDRKYPL